MRGNLKFWLYVIGIGGILPHPKSRFPFSLGSVLRRFLCTVHLFAIWRQTAVLTVMNYDVGSHFHMFCYTQNLVSQFCIMNHRALYQEVCTPFVSRPWSGGVCTWSRRWLCPQRCVWCLLWNSLNYFLCFFSLLYFTFWQLILSAFIPCSI
jgi:hypothetical protein